MKEKKTNCKYCGGVLEAKTTRREFCSNKCKVYWFREHKQDITKVAKPPTIEEKKKESTPPQQREWYRSDLWKKKMGLK